MSGLVTIFRRELSGLFFGPLAWVLLCVALVFNGALFALYLGQTAGDTGDSLRLALGESIPYWAVMVVLPPLLTMKMISEESRSGQLEFLLTAPVTDLSVVLGKLLAAVAFMAILWSSVLVYALVIQFLGTTPDWGPVFGAYFGAVLTSALFCSIGLVASTSTSAPILAAFMAFVANAGILLLPFLLESLGAHPSNWIGALSRRVNVIARLQGSFTAGTLDTAHLAFFGVWIAFFVFLATRLLESRRWR
jgi:ABC-2 type transport system permease protein